MTADTIERELPGDEDLDEQDKLVEVRILLIGDPGVGKTSLINSLVNDEFVSNLPARMADITIPAAATPENVPIHIIDYSEREQSSDELDLAIKSSNVICIVYDANEDEGLDRVAKHWIPLVRLCQKDQGVYKPIILVANKTDTLIEETVLDRVSNIIQEFVDIEAFIEVSALSQKNVVELFSSAQKAIIYPMAPLFDPQMRVLTKKCQNALIEIFKLSDYDGDELLSDHELNLFQENCFGTPLQKDALDDLKIIIKQSTIDGIDNDCLTQNGFLFLHTLSIDKGRLDFTWQVLRKFNYDNRLNSTTNSTSKLLDEIADDFSHHCSISSHENRDSSVQSTSGSTDASQTNDPFGDLINQLDVNWLRENQNLIKTGVGLTLATLLSFLALRYLVRGNSRSSL